MAQAGRSAAVAFRPQSRGRSSRIFPSILALNQMLYVVALDRDVGNVLDTAVRKYLSAGAVPAAARMPRSANLRRSAPQTLGAASSAPTTQSMDGRNCHTSFKGVALDPAALAVVEAQLGTPACALGLICVLVPLTCGLLF